jgi:endonuclease-3
MDLISLSKIDFLSIKEKLCKALGEPDLLHQSSPLAYCDTALDVLVATILTQATSDRNALKSWLEFKKIFPEMESVLEKEEEFLVETIRSGGLAKQKAKTIRAVLKSIRDRFSKLSLESPEKDIDLIREMLLSLPGIGPKTAACVLLFGFKLPAFPVDIHIHRIAIRMGWVNSKTSPEETEQILSPIIPADLHAALHILLLNLGRRYCRPHNPNCTECPLNQDCKKAY